MEEIQNAIIQSVEITNKDHDMLLVWINLKFKDYNQGFGGYELYSPRFKIVHNKAGYFMYRLLQLADVHEWNQLKGKPIRVKSEGQQIIALGHIVNDDWYCP
jgi:hypothetical protein